MPLTNPVLPCLCSQAALRESESSARAIKRSLLTLINHVLSVKSSSEGVFSQDSFLEPMETPRQCLGKPGSSSHEGKEEHARDWEKLMAKATTALDGVAKLSEERERELQDTQLQLRLVRPSSHPCTPMHAFPRCYACMRNLLAATRLPHAHSGRPTPHPAFVSATERGA